MLPLLPALLLFAFVASATPGPNNLMLMTSGLNFGFRRTLPHFWGVDLGFALMTLLVGLGLARGLRRGVPVLLTVLKWVGAAYLVYARGQDRPLGADQERHGAARSRSTFLQAAAFQWVNPKAWIMAVTACATYTDPNRYTPACWSSRWCSGSSPSRAIAAWVGFGAALQRWLSHPRNLALFNYTMAALLIASLYPVFRE